MRRWIGFVALAATMPAAALAGPVNYFCTSPLSQAGNVQVDQAGPTYRVRGRLRISELERPAHPSQSDRPGADVKVIGNDSSNVIMLYVLTRPAADGAAQVADIAARTIMPQGGGDERPLGTISYREGPGWDELPFDIEVQADRAIVTAGGRREEFATRIGPNATIEMTCLGGHFAFQDVDWGN